MGIRHSLTLLISCVIWPALATSAPPTNFGPLDSALKNLAREKAFSGAVVVRGTDGVRFKAAYGWADPFTRRRFATTTPVDGASLAKPMTAAAVLLLARENRIDLNAPAVRYIAEFPHPGITVMHLLTHSAGLPDYDQLEPLAGKTNADLLIETTNRRLSPAFLPGSGFAYCNTCYDSLALLIERVARQPYLDFLKARIKLPSSVARRPRALALWRGRAVGFRNIAGGSIERADSHEDEIFYGSSNLSITADALAEWGTQWWSGLAALRELATSPATIGEGVSGLTLGNWYCAPDRARCHYLGHHEGFHHMLYWDAERRLSIAMVTNNSLAPELQQRLQRAIVAFATRQSALGSAELQAHLPRTAIAPGLYRTSANEVVTIDSNNSTMLRLTRRGVRYALYQIGVGISYAPGVDLYIAGLPDGRLRLLSLYEDEQAQPLRKRN